MRYLALALFLLPASDAYCAGSMEPLYVHADAVMDTSIVGNWIRMRDSTHTDSMVVKLGNPRDSAYRVTTLGDNGEEQQHDVHLMRIAGLTVADIYTDHVAAFALSVHGIVFVRLGRDRITLYSVDTDWLQKYSAAHPKDIHFTVTQGIALFSDSAAHVRAFIAKQGNSGLRSSDSSTYVRAPAPGSR